jgi:hypothetical protein
VSKSRVPVAEAGDSSGTEEGERLPLEDVTRQRLVKTQQTENT